MTRRLSPLRRALAAAAIVLGLLGATAAGSALAQVSDTPTAAAADQATLNEIERSVGIEAIPADYVILCDTSGSMETGGRLAALKEQLGDFLAALAPGDTISLITFDSVATTVYQGLAGTDPAVIVGRLPATAAGAYTDIGSAVQAAVQTLARQNAPDIATIVLITDGRHEPPPGSAYPLPEGFAWEELRRQAAALGQQSLSGYALPLGAEAASGAELLASVFPATTTVDATEVTEVTRLLEQPKAAVRAAKIATALADDLGRGVQVSWPESTIDVGERETNVTVTVTARTERIPITVSGLRVSADQPGVTVTADLDRLELDPGESRPVTVTIAWNMAERSLEFRNQRAIDASVRLTGQVDSRWRETLASDLRISFHPPAIDSRVPARGVLEVGSPHLWLGGVGGLVVLLVAIVWWFGAHPRLAGVLEINNPRNETTQVKLSRLRAKKVLRGKPLSEEVLNRIAPLKVRVRRGKQGRQLHLEFTTQVGNHNEQRRELLSPERLLIVRGVGFRWRPRLKRAAAPRPTAARPVAPEIVAQPAPPLGPPPAAQPLGPPPVAHTPPQAAHTPPMGPPPMPNPPPPVSPRLTSVPVPPSPTRPVAVPATQQAPNIPPPRVAPPNPPAEAEPDVDDGPSFRFE